MNHLPHPNFVALAQLDLPINLNDPGRYQRAAGAPAIGKSRQLQQMIELDVIKRSVREGVFNGFHKLQRQGTGAID